MLELQLEDLNNLNISLEKKIIFLEMEKTSLEKINSKIEADMESNYMQETSFFTIRSLYIFIGSSLLGGLFIYLHLKNNSFVYQVIANQTKCNTESVIKDVINAVEAIKVVEVVKVVEIVKANENIINSMYI